MIHLDTSFLIRLLDPDAPETRLLETMDPDESIVVSALAWAEFQCGPLKPAEREKATRIVDSYRDFTIEHAGVAARLFNESGRRRGSLLDCAIAAVAIHDGARLATANLTDFRRFETAGLRLIGHLGSDARPGWGDAGSRPPPEVQDSGTGWYTGGQRADPVWNGSPAFAGSPASSQTRPPGVREASLAGLSAPELHRKYWDAVLDELNRVGGPVSGNSALPPFARRTPAGDNWMNFPIGRSGFYLYTTTHRAAGRISASLYMSKHRASAFDRLMRDREAIESAMGSPMVWDDQKPNEREIGVLLKNVALNDPNDWARQHEWLVRKLNLLDRVFRPRIKRLP